MATSEPVPDAVEFQFQERKSTNTVWQRFRRHRLAVFGLVVLGIMCFAAIFADQLSAHDPYTVDLDQLRAPPSASHILGTDAAGRDVFARQSMGPASRCR